MHAAFLASQVFATVAQAAPVGQIAVEPAAPGARAAQPAEAAAGSAEAEGLVDSWQHCLFGFSGFCHSVAQAPPVGQSAVEPAAR